MKTEMKDLYYIQNKERGYVGNSMLWWERNDCGYVCDIRRAKVFTKSEAENIEKESVEKKFLMWKKEYIDARISHHIDMQHCDKDFRKK